VEIPTDDSQRYPKSAHGLPSLTTLEAEYHRLWAQACRAAKTTDDPGFGVKLVGASLRYRARCLLFQAVALLGHHGFIDPLHEMRGLAGEGPLPVPEPPAIVADNSSCFSPGDRK